MVSAAAGAVTQVWSLALLSGLRIWHCRSSGSDSILGLGMPYTCGVAKNRKKKKVPKRKKLILPLAICYLVNVFTMWTSFGAENLFKILKYLCIISSKHPKKKKKKKKERDFFFKIEKKKNLYLKICV